MPVPEYEVYMPDEEDEAVRDYIRMREDHKKQLRVIKQQICALTHRHGLKFTDGKNYWTQKHLKWLKELPLEGVLKETFDAYLLSYETVSERIAQMDKKIEEIAEQDKYRETVHKLICFKGVKTLTALAVIVEIGDFTRFVKAKNFAAFLGLVSGELSTSDDQNRLFRLRSDGHSDHNPQGNQAEFQYRNDFPVTGFDIAVRRVKEFIHE